MQLITRLDFDGLLCAAMIAKVEDVSELFFANPRELESRQLSFNFEPGGAVAHLPFHPDASIWFHHHDFEHRSSSDLKSVRGKWGPAPSTARLVYEYYGESKTKGFGSLVEIADKLGTAKLDKDDILKPGKWMLVAATLDPHIPEDSDYGLLIYENLKNGSAVEEILALEPVAERVQRYHDNLEGYRKILANHTKMDGNVIVTDFRDYETAPRGNRFVVFHDFPDGNVQVQIEKHQKLASKYLVSASRSIFHRDFNVKIGELMEQYGGGGIKGAGTCPLDSKNLDARLNMIINSLKE